MNNKNKTMCPLCGSEVEQSRGFLYLQFDCKSDKCRARTFIPLIDTTEAEALKRFQVKPESAWEKAWNELKQYLFDSSRSAMGSSSAEIANRYNYVLGKMETLEKELKDE